MDRLNVVVIAIGLAGTAGCTRSWLPDDVRARLTGLRRDHGWQGTELQAGELEASLFRGAPPEREGAAERVIDGYRSDVKPTHWTVRVVAAVADPCRTGESGVTLYQLEADRKNPCEGLTIGPADHPGLPACEREHFDVYAGKAIAVSGGWGKRGNFVAAAADNPFFTFSCLGGVVAKCVRWGYVPSRGADVAALHQSCVRAARADYCGTGRAHTCRETVIDLVDRAGIQTRAADPERDVLESDWDADGATCLNYARLPGCSSDTQQVALKQAIAAECEVVRHVIAINGCTAVCPDGSPTCGQALRTWTLPNQKNLCSTSRDYCKTSPP